MPRQLSLPKVQKARPLLCDEEYPPLDGAYQNRNYGNRLSKDTVRSFWRKTLRLIRAGKAPSDVGLYVHWPFCRDRCAYCYCDSRISSDMREGQVYLEGLLSELRSFKDLFDGVSFTSLIIAGGTPTQAAPELLNKLFEEIYNGLGFAHNADIAVEATPATLTENQIRILSQRGVRRIDMGIDSFDPIVLKAAGRRGQSYEQVKEVFRGAHKAGVAIEVGLMYGLENQTGGSFLKDLAQVLCLRPAQVRLYGFDPRPQTLFAQEGRRLSFERRASLPEVFGLADKIMRRGGYGTSKRMWQVPASYLGLGHSAKSRCFGAGWYQHPLLGRNKKVSATIPPFIGMPMTLAEERRACVIGSLSTLGRLPRGGFKNLFGVDVMSVGGLGGVVRSLEKEGLVRVDQRELKMNRSSATVRHGALRRLYGAGVRKELDRTYGRDWQAPVGTFENATGLECRVYVRSNGGDA